MTLPDPHPDIAPSQPMFLSMNKCTNESHRALKLDPVQWQSLQFIGYQRMPAVDDLPEETLELRNCACGSTLCVEIKGG